jgi:hypothetical protein
MHVSGGRTKPPIVVHVDTARSPFAITTTGGSPAVSEEPVEPTQVYESRPSPVPYAPESNSDDDDEDENDELEEEEAKKAKLTMQGR